MTLAQTTHSDTIVSEMHENLVLFLVTVAPNHTMQIADKVKKLQYVEQVYTVIGPFDLIVYAKAVEMGKLKKLKHRLIPEIDGIKQVQVLIRK